MSCRNVSIFLSVLLAFAPAHAEAPLAVQAVEAQPVEAVLRLELSGAVEPAEAIPVGFRNGGQIIEMTVEVGDEVASGDLLARVDPTQPRAALVAAEAQTAAAEATLTQARQARERAAGLTARGAATQAALDAATQALLTAQSTLEQAQAQKAKAEQTMRDTEIHAPVAGIVTARDAEPGQVIGAAQTVLTLARAGQRLAVFHLPDAPELDGFLGRDIALQSLDGSGEITHATVTEISPVVIAASGTVQVKARLIPSGAQPGLGAAISGRVDLPLAQAVSIPEAALVSDRGGPAVWTVDPQSRAVALRPVEVLRYTSDAVDLSGGIEAGTLVVTSGAHLLYPGRPVTLSEGAN